MFERLIGLIGEEKLKEIERKKILLIGVGGVGSYALEALIRNGFYDITIVDFDIIDLSNLNRQLITDSTNIGKYKVDEAKKRALLINPNIKIQTINEKLNKENLRNLLNQNFDYIIDACDTLDVKFALMENSIHYSYKLISSMGTAKKIDPTKLEITTLDKTNNDPIARLLRNKVRKAHVNKKIYVVSSTEVPKQINMLGTANLVPSVAGLLCVSFIFNDIIKNK
ncbi:tRNA threonylcarbamoyladenosine dehydratase [bacterium]|nr:tRNA threonylcarbamoyladenosine dehydratase [bacterium]MBD9115016.1 tRNA threonylcarbamoyladenosine dehydratase [bacterium]